MSSLRLTASALCCVVVVLGVLLPFSDAQLDPSFYNSTCPNVRSIVRNVLTNVSASDPRMLASLIRLHFHDCFVQVCIYFGYLALIYTLSLVAMPTLFSLHCKVNHVLPISITQKYNLFMNFFAIHWIIKCTVGIGAL